MEKFKMTQFNEIKIGQKSAFKLAHCDHWDDPRVGEFASHVIRLSRDMAETCAIDPAEMLAAVIETAEYVLQINAKKDGG